VLVACAKDAGVGGIDILPDETGPIVQGDAGAAMIAYRSADA
jgi:hypothetical protein